MAEYKFWMVWREGGGVPTKKHTSEYEAGVEARRLIAAFPHARFYVLESVGAYSAPPASFIWTPTDETRPIAERECNRGQGIPW